MAGTRRALAVADQLAIQGLLASYCQIVDDGEFERLGEIFAPDVLHTIDGMGADTVRHAGLSEVLTFVTARQVESWRGKHILSIPLIEAADAPEPGAAGATALTEVTFINRATPDRTLQIATTGRYHDTLQRVDGRWAIVRRAISMF